MPILPLIMLRSGLASTFENQAEFSHVLTATLTSVGTDFLAERLAALRDSTLPSLHSLTHTSTQSSHRICMTAILSFKR